MKRWYVAGIFVAGLAIGGTVVALVAGSDDSSPKAKTSTTPTASVSSTPGVADNAKTLINRLDAVTKTTYHVRYTTGSGSSSHATLETWHTVDRTRRDVIAVSPTQGTAHTEEFVTKDKYVRCVQFDGGAFQCVGAPIAEGATVTDPLQGADKGVVGRKVTTSTDTIAGTAVTCFSVAADPSLPAPANGVAKFCLAPNNVPLLIDGGDGKPVTATSFDKKVPDSVFTPPATVATS